MGSESEECVDILLVKTNEIHDLLANFDHNNATKARELLNTTQAYIDDNKSIIPSYCLKKVSDALRRLEKCLDETGKSKLHFQFKSKPAEAPISSSPVHTNTTPNEVVKEVVVTPFFGFREKQGEHLVLEDVEYKDISLTNLEGCHVRIYGLANTVYIKSLKNTTVVICLACRAITITNCTDCNFTLVCQQLRIDSTTKCNFRTHISVRSMLESSRELIFKQLKIDSLEGIQLDKIRDLFKTATFDESKNNWKCIDDFDWLSPTIPSKNYNIINDD